MSIELEWIVDQYYNKIQYNKFSNIRNSRERLAQIIFLNNTTSDPYINGLTLLPHYWVSASTVLYSPVSGYALLHILDLHDAREARMEVEEEDMVGGRLT